LKNVLCGRLGRYPWWQTLLPFPREEKDQAYHLLADLGLGSYVHRRAAEVSGGEQQRTALLRALFQEPELILAMNRSPSSTPTSRAACSAFCARTRTSNSAPSSACCTMRRWSSGSRITLSA
jgi:phosphonate transport system ATP-binding protein